MKVPIAVIKCANFGGAKRHKSVFGKGFYGLLVNTKQDVKNTWLLKLCIMVGFGQSGLFWSEIVQMRVGEYCGEIHALSIVM